VKFAPCLRHDLRQVYAMVYAGIATFLRQVRVLKIEGGIRLGEKPFCPCVRERQG